jgi:hypothetical protein
MGFNSAFKWLKLFKKPGNGRLNSLNDPVLNVLMKLDFPLRFFFVKILKYKISIKPV